MEFTNELRDKIMKTDPAQIGHFIEGGFMSPTIKPIFSSAKMCGPAYTVRASADVSTIVYYAMERAPKGSVIVIDRAGDTTYACCGLVVATLAKSLGMAGIVIDGPATDSRGIEALDFPVFCTGLSAVTTKHGGFTGQYNIPVQCGGAVVNPGDIVFGDADGVIVIPPEKCEELAEKAIKADENEVVWLEAFRNGKTMSDFINVDRIMETDMHAYINQLKKLD
jgi:regulator of RNase E activity RraA